MGKSISLELEMARSIFILFDKSEALKISTLKSTEDIPVFFPEINFYLVSCFCLGIHTDE